MSDTVLRIIPTDPVFVPTPEAAVGAEAFLRRMFPNADAITSQRSDEVRFVDCGSNLERVLCPHCGTDLLMNDVWPGLVNDAYRTRFLQLSVVLRCCGATASLNDLAYDFPCGFASYALEARNPGVPRLTDEQTAALEMALGCGVRAIWARI